VEALELEADTETEAEGVAEATTVTEATSADMSEPGELDSLDATANDQQKQKYVASSK